MEKNNTELNLIDSVGSEKLTELTTDMVEVAIDSIMKEGVLRDIPILGGLYKISKVAMSFREGLLIKKVAVFLFQLKDIPIEKRKKFVDELNSSDKLQQRVGETLMIILDKTDHMLKPQIMGRLFKAQIEGEITISKCLRLCSIVEKSFVEDLYSLPNYTNKRYYELTCSESLHSLGLVYDALSGGAWVSEDGKGRQQSF